MGLGWDWGEIGMGLGSRLVHPKKANKTENRVFTKNLTKSTLFTRSTKVDVFGNYATIVV